jgi:hypothetical protein
VYCERNEYPKHAASPRNRNTLFQFVSRIGMEKHTSPTYTLKMAAEISFVSLVPTDESTKKNFQKPFVP